MKGTVQGMREHLRERSNMAEDNAERIPHEDREECLRDHNRIETPYCPECGQSLVQG